MIEIITSACTVIKSILEFWFVNSVVYAEAVIVNVLKRMEIANKIQKNFFMIISFQVVVLNREA